MDAKTLIHIRIQSLFVTYSLFCVCVAIILSTLQGHHPPHIGAIISPFLRHQS